MNRRRAAEDGEADDVATVATNRRIDVDRVDSAVDQVDYDCRMQDTLASIFEYNRWADERLLTACGQLTDEQYAREIGGSFPSIRATVAHHAGALRAWGTRFEGGEVTSLPSEAEVPNAEVALRLIVQGHEPLAREASRPAEELNEIFTYRSLRGLWSACRAGRCCGTWRITGRITAGRL